MIWFHLSMHSRMYVCMIIACAGVAGGPDQHMEGMGLERFGMTLDGRHVVQLAY